LQRLGHALGYHLPFQTVGDYVTWHIIWVQSCSLILFLDPSLLSPPGHQLVSWWSWSPKKYLSRDSPPSYFSLSLNRHLAVTLPRTCWSVHSIVIGGSGKKDRHSLHPHGA
jgi:hypothetical protein